MIKIMPSLQVEFCADIWNAQPILEKANCYSLALNAFHLAAINPGSLNASHDNNGDNNKLLQVEGMSELMEKDGWVRHCENDVDPSRYHMVALFGYRRTGMPINDCHFFFINEGRIVSEKEGIGLQAQIPQKQCGAAIRVEELKDYFNKDRAQSIMPPVYGGLWRMPKNGLFAHPRHLLLN